MRLPPEGRPLPPRRAVPQPRLLSTASASLAPREPDDPGNLPQLAQIDPKKCPRVQAQPCQVHVVEEPRDDQVYPVSRRGSGGQPEALGVRDEVVLDAVHDDQGSVQSPDDAGGGE